jgi:hypothetical protein
VLSTCLAGERSQINLAFASLPKEHGVRGGECPPIKWRVDSNWLIALSALFMPPTEDIKNANNELGKTWEGTPNSKS